MSAVKLELVGANEALRVASREALKSSLDTSASLVDVERVLDAAQCDSALDALAAHTADGLLKSATAGAFLAVLPLHPRVVEIYAQIAGLSFRELRDRAAAKQRTLPTSPGARWSVAQLSTVVEIVNAVVSAPTPVRGTAMTFAQPIELLTAVDGNRGWDLVQHSYQSGITYGQLISQRLVGGSWGAHRNGTASAFRDIIASMVTGGFDAAGIRYWTTAVGSDSRVSKAFLAEQVVMAGKSLGQLAVVTRGDDGAAVLAIFVAVANDGGTARKTAATLRTIPAQLRVKSAVVLAGPGWSTRGESDDLVQTFDGRAFGDRNLLELVMLAKALAHRNNDVT